MTDDSTSDQARKGLLDSVKGKAKEIAGAVTGNDSLTAEGQLEQTQAQERKEANSVEAVAKAEADQARQQQAEAQKESFEARREVDAETTAVKTEARAQSAAQKQAAEAAAQRDAAAQRTQAEAEAARKAAVAKAAEDAKVEHAVDQVEDALDEHQRAARDAAAPEVEAQRLRREAEALTDQADLP
jgi:uncharacterized protein YjbJ (UPF0337 family)